MRPINLLFIVIFCGLPLLWYVPTMIWGFQITKESMEGDGAVSKDLIGGPAPIQWFKNRAELRAYYSLEDITDRREVSFQFQMEFNDLLAPGEDVPDPALHELYVKARAPALLISYCPELLGSMAKSCDVNSAGGSISRDGRVTVSGGLGYLPAYDFGNVADVENGDIMSARVELFPRDSELLATLENRALAITKALKLCDEVRRQLGNCVIADLSIRETRMRRAEPEDPNHLHVTARLAVYADKTLYRRESLENEVERIQTGVIN